MHFGASKLYVFLKQWDGTWPFTGSPLGLKERKHLQSYLCRLAQVILFPNKAVFEQCLFYSFECLQLQGFYNSVKGSLEGCSPLYPQSNQGLSS